MPSPSLSPRHARGSPTDDYRLTRRITNAGLILIGAVLLLALLQMIVEWMTEPLPDHLRRYLMLNHERSAPTWVNGGLFLAAALGAGLAILTARDRRERWGWTILALAIAFLSFDEIVSIHEFLPEIVGIERGSFITHEWLIPGVVVALVGSISVGFFVSALPKPVPRRLLVALLVFFTGAFFFEGLAQFLFRSLGPEHWVSRYVAPLMNIPEEGLEMLGCLIAVRAIVQHLERSGMFTPTRAGHGPLDDRNDSAK